jgi:serine/threonine protein kinase
MDILNHVGGEILGTGAWGTVIDTCDNSGNSLCSLIGTKDIVTVYYDDKNSVITDTQKFKKFVSYYNGIAKTFSREDKFIREIQENQKVLKIHRNYPKYITIDQPIYDGQFITGASIRKPNKTYVYVIFGSKCNPKYELNYTNVFKFIADILEKIRVINSNGYFHNDIKLANIMLCDGQFNLIDWGTSGYQPKYHNAYDVGGAPIYTSPMKLYLTSKHNQFKYIRRQNIPYIVLKSYILKGRKDYDYLSHGVFTPDSDPNRKKYLEIKNLLIRRHEQFLDIIHQFDYDEQQIYDKYKLSFDVYMLGMTILHVIFKFNLEYNEQVNGLFKLVKKFTSLKNPLDIDGAITVFNKLIE